MCCRTFIRDDVCSLTLCSVAWLMRSLTCPILLTSIALHWPKDAVASTIWWWVVVWLEVSVREEPVKIECVVCQKFCLRSGQWCLYHIYFWLRLVGPLSIRSALRRYPDSVKERESSSITEVSFLHFLISFFFGRSSPSCVPNCSYYVFFLESALLLFTSSSIQQRSIYQLKIISESSPLEIWINFIQTIEEKRIKNYPEALSLTFAAL